MIGLAVGIDYALFILSRHRSQLAAGMDPEDRPPGGRHGRCAVVFAGLTVVIALSGLVVVGIPFLTVMGVAAAGTVLVAVLVALTLLRPCSASPARGSPGSPGSRAARRERPTPTWTTGRRRLDGRPLDPAGHPAAAAHRASSASPACSSSPSRRRSCGSALPDNSSRPDTTQRQAYDLISRTSAPASTVRWSCSSQDLDPATGSGPPGDPAALGGTPAATPGEFSGGLDDVADAAPDPAPRRDTALVRSSRERPAGQATGELVADLRDRPRPRERTGTDLEVTGQTAVAIDVSDRLGDALLPFALVVVGLAFVLLLLVFRSILVPIKAALGFLLSVGASFGAVVAVFQWGWFAELLDVPSTGPVISFMPIILMARAVRAGHGLRGLPGLPDARGLRARRRAREAVVTAPGTRRAW